MFFGDGGARLTALFRTFKHGPTRNQNLHYRIHSTPKTLLGSATEDMRLDEFRSRLCRKKQRNCSQHQTRTAREKVPF